MQSISINGIATDYVSAMDRGLHYGDGIFETIACINYRLQFWQQHMDRMAAAAEKLNISFPGDRIFLQDIQNLLDMHPPSQSCVIKLILTRGSGERGYRCPVKPQPCRIVIRSNWPAGIDQVIKHGARLRICDTQIAINPQLAGIKHLNRLENVLARNEWRDDYDEGLMTDGQGHIIEGTMSNLFAVRDGILYTPALDQCGVSGIIRQQLILLANELKISVQEKPITLTELMQMDEILLTNSVIGLWPVTQFSERTYSIGNVSISLASQLTARANEHAHPVG